MIVNGGFETGNFFGWKTIGDTSIETATFGAGPSEGEFDALLTTESGSVNDLTVENFLGINNGTLDNLNNGNATQGSAIYQDFKVKAGDVLTFNWKFLTNELSFDKNPDTFNDFAFYSIENLRNNTGSVTELVDTNQFNEPFISSGTVFADETNGDPRINGFQTETIQFEESGVYRLGFGVLDVGDTGFDSGLLIDGVQIMGTDSKPIDDFQIKEIDSQAELR